MSKVPEIKDAEAITDSVDMLNMRCVRLADKGKDDDAIKCYDSMMNTFGPSYAMANFMKGTLLIKKNKFEEAKICLKEAEKMSPKTPDIKMCLAVCEARMGQKGNARGLISEALELDPKNPTILISASLLYYEMGEKENGTKYMNHAMEINPYAAFFNWEMAVSSCLSNPNVSESAKNEMRAGIKEIKSILDGAKATEENAKKKKK